MKVEIPPYPGLKRAPKGLPRFSEAGVWRRLQTFEFLSSGASETGSVAIELAKKDFQSFLGQEPTGDLTDRQNHILATAWRYHLWGHALWYPNMVAEVGVRGLLNAVVDPQYPVQFGDPPLDPVAARTNKRPALPRSAQAPQSMTAYCEQLVTGIAQENAATIAPSDLGEAVAFCARRDLSIELAYRLFPRLLEPATEIRDHCISVVQALSQQMTELSTTPPSEILTSVAPIMATLGLSDPEQARVYGTLCLGLGYDSDNERMALAGALLLLDAGATPTAQVISRHLRLGPGAMQRQSQLAEQWVALVAK